MSVYIELSYSNDRKSEARKDLIELIAQTYAIRREIITMQSRISAYEGYVLDALDRQETELAQEIAEKIAQMESELRARQEAGAYFEDRVQYLRSVFNRIEQRIDQDQYMLDYLEASIELNGGGDAALERKMQAAGIGKKANAGRTVLERIRESRQ